jgi:phenylpropionate dioxygenase-like ring-hydroxylating dioxygenase large terminal subunit
MTTAAPPTFAEAANLRQKACAAGLDPSYWYAVENDEAVKVGKVVEVKFWKTSIALFRDEKGELHAVENRCAHRQVLLSEGRVEGCRLTCRYHGWSYDADGRLADIPHELFGRPFPSVQLRSYPVEVRYGLIWIFFGDPDLAASRPIPIIDELEGSSPWVCVPIDFTWKSHHAMIVNNVMDSTHVASLHRQFRTKSFVYGPVTRCEATGDRVLVEHDIKMNGEGMLWYIANRIKIDKQQMVYDYPYLWVGVGAVFKLWNFMLPIDERTTRIFMLACTESMRVPFTKRAPPAVLLKYAIKIAREILVRPLFDEDGWSTEAEQQGYDQHFAKPTFDFHPAPRLSYQLTVRKWEEAERRAQASSGASAAPSSSSSSSSSSSDSAAAWSA